MFKKTISALVLVAIAMTFAPTAFAKGGGSRGSFRSSPSRSYSTPRPSVAPTPKPSVAPVSKPSTPTPTKPSRGQVDSYKKSLKSNPSVTPVKKSASGKTLSTKSRTVGQNGYNPRFSNGYSAPAGSIVYYNQHSMLDYLPWVFLFTMNSHREATIYPPSNGTSTTAVAPVTVKEEGLDTMYVINWIIMIVLSLGLIWLIMYLVNRKTNTHRYV